MRTYGQYCPIARGAEIFAERWTPLIIRNLSLGCGSFSEILHGAPGLSRTLLSQRLKQLERLGVVESAPKPDGRGHRYELTSAGHELFVVCRSLGEWGARWLELAPEHLDPFVALWSMCKALRRDQLPKRRVVIRFDFTGRPRPERYWLLIELGDTEICKTSPGPDEDLNGRLTECSGRLGDALPSAQSFREASDALAGEVSAALCDDASSRRQSRAMSG